MSDRHILGAFRMGYTAIGVTEPLFERWKKQGLTSKITLKQRVVNPSGDLYTQHPNISWTDRTIDAVVKLGPAGREDLDLGVSGSLDGVIRTRSPFKMLDCFDFKGSHYEVISPPIEVRGRNSGFLYRKAAFKHVELEDL